MITAQSSFIPLFFDEAESDLWLALQRIEPEERSAFIKSVLRQALIGERTEGTFMEGKQNPERSLPVAEENSGLGNKACSVDILVSGSESTGSFSLEALFEVNIPDQDPAQVAEFDLESLTENQPIHSAGFEYMMKHIIGTEEDEAVLEVLRGSGSQCVNAGHSG